jgi:arsenate reductase-like glutaredoxin family protein
VDADDVYQKLREILDEKLQEVYRQMNLNKKEVIDIMQKCQDARDTFHRESVPEYNRLLCKEKRRRGFTDKVLVIVVSSICVAVILGGYKTIVTLHQILELLATKG